ncbi:OmpA family protein [Vibrio mimicus]
MKKSLISLSILLSFPAMANCFNGSSEQVQIKKHVSTHLITTQVRGRLSETQVQHTNQILNESKQQVEVKHRSDLCTYDEQSQSLLLHYPFNKYQLSGPHQEILQTYVSMVDSQYKIVVEGHADQTGNPKYNQALSERRAGAVTHYLRDTLKLGNRIVEKGFGESAPVCTVQENAQTGCNRRVVLTIQPQ